MNYRREMKKMRKHRKRYHPVMAGLMELYTSRTIAFPVKITDIGKMAIILELLDIGYLDDRSFIVRKSFGDITSLTYNGRYPFTQAGDSIFRQLKRVTVKELLRGIMSRLFNR